MSLPLAGAPPAPLTPTPPAPRSLGAASPRKAAAVRHLRPAGDGPTLHVTLVGASFHTNGKYYLSLSAAGLKQHTEPSDGRTFDSGMEFSFPLCADDSFGLELVVSATRVQALPHLSPRGIMANLDERGASEHESVRTGEDAAAGWAEDVGTARLSLAQLLSAPQPAGGACKHHEVELFAPPSPSSSSSSAGEGRQARGRCAAQVGNGGSPCGGAGGRRACR